ncbi:hypothetical protein B0H13DRAFT_2541157, partial [Mycena leptocephala]
RLLGPPLPLPHLHRGRAHPLRDGDDVQPVLHLEVGCVFVFELRVSDCTYTRGHFVSRPYLTHVPYMSNPYLAAHPCLTSLLSLQYYSLTPARIANHARQLPRETYEDLMKRSEGIEQWSNDIYKPAPSRYRYQPNGLAQQQHQQQRNRNSMGFSLPPRPGPECFADLRRDVTSPLRTDRPAHRLEQALFPPCLSASGPDTNNDVLPDVSCWERSHPRAPMKHVREPLCPSSPRTFASSTLDFCVYFSLVLLFCIYRCAPPL